MALFVRQDEERSEIQKKVAAGLKNKGKTKPIKQAETEPVLLENEHQTRPAGVIISLFVLAVIIAAVVVFFINQ